LSPRFVNSPPNLNLLKANKDNNLNLIDDTSHRVISTEAGITHKGGEGGGGAGGERGRSRVVKSQTALKMKR